MTPEAKRRKNQKKKLKQKQKKAAAAAAAVAVAATTTIVVNTTVTDVSTTTAGTDSATTENNTLDLTSSTVSDETNVNTRSNTPLNKGSTIQEEKEEITIPEEKEEDKTNFIKESEISVEVVEQTSSEVGSHQAPFEKDVQEQELEFHNDVNETLNQADDAQSLNEYNEEGVERIDLSEGVIDADDSESELMQQGNGLNETMDKIGEKQNELSMEQFGDKIVGHETFIDNEHTQNKVQFTNSSTTDAKENVPLPTHTVIQIEDKTSQEVEEQQMQNHEQLHQSTVVRLNKENVEFPTIINSEGLGTDSNISKNDKMDFPHKESATTQPESFSENHLTTQEFINDDLFESSPRDELMPWEQHEELYQNKDKQYHHNIADERNENEPELVGDVSELFTTDNNEEFLPWIENKASKKTEINDSVIEHDVDTVSALVPSTSHNENKNSQVNIDIKQVDNTSDLFDKDIDQTDEIWLKETNNNVPSSPLTSVTHTVEPTDASTTKINLEPSRSVVNDSFKKFSFLKDDDDLLDDDDDSFLESEDELVTQNVNRSDSFISSEGITFDNTSRNNSKKQFHTTSRYTPTNSDMMVSDQNTLSNQGGTVGIVLPQQINNISRPASNIQPSQGSTIQLSSQGLTRPSLNSQNTQQVIEKLAVEKKKSDAYDFPMDLIADKVKPVHAKPVGIPSPKLNNTSFLPMKSSRNVSVSIRSTSGYQSLDAVSNISMPVNPYASVIKKEAAAKQPVPLTGPVGVVPPSLNLPVSPTSPINSNNMISFMSSPPLQGNARNFSNNSSISSAQLNARSNIYAPQTEINAAPPKRASQSSQYAPRSSNTLQSAQALPSQYNFPPSNGNPRKSMTISPVNTKLNYTSSTSKGNHARKNSSLYSPNSNENSSRYAPTVHPQYQQQLETIQSNFIPHPFPATSIPPKPNTMKQTVSQINPLGIIQQYPPHPINDNENISQRLDATSQLDSFSNHQVSGTGLSQSVSGGSYNNKKSEYHSNKMILEIDNNALLSRQFPLFQFNSSSKLVYGIPVSMGSYATTTSVVNSLEVVSLDSIIKSDPILKSFPGPLTQKSKQKDIEKWLSTIIEETNLDTNSDEYLIWKILQIKLSLNCSINDISEVIYNTYELQTYLSQPFNLNISQPNAYKLDNIGQMRILASLQVGDYNTALRDALGHKDHTMALLIGSLISKDKLVDAVDSYFVEEGNNPTCINLLSLIFHAFMGNSKVVIKKFYSDNEKATWIVDNWRTVVAAVLKHCSNYDSDNKIPPVIIEFFVELAIFLYHKGLKLVASLLFMIVDVPLSMIPVLKDSDVTFDYIGNPTSVQSIVWSELYQYYCVVQNSKSSDYDELLPQKIYHGMYLQEQGLSNLATKYSDYVASRLKQLNKKDVTSLNLSSRLGELQSRLIGSNSGWLLKPKLSSVWGQLDKSFNKYIGGDEDASPTPSDTFGKYVVGNEEIIKSSPNNIINNYVGGNIETSPAVMGIGKTTNRPVMYSPKKYSFVKKPIEKSLYVPKSQTLSTSNILEEIQPSPVKTTMYSLRTNNSVPVNISSHFNHVEPAKQNDKEISDAMVSEKRNESLEEPSILTLQPKETDIVEPVIKDVSTELQSIPLPVDNSDASLLAHSNIEEVSTNQDNIPSHRINEVCKQGVNIDDSQQLKNNSVELSIGDNKMPLPVLSESVSSITDDKILSSNAIHNDLSHSIENEIASVTEDRKEMLSTFTTRAVSYVAENSISPSPGAQMATSIPVGNNFIPPFSPQGLTSIPLVQPLTVETKNESDRQKPVFNSTKYNSFAVSGMDADNLDSFEPRIRPSSSAAQGVPSVKISEEANVQYNDEVEDDSDEDEDKETIATKKDTETKKKVEKNNSGSQKAGWFSWLKKDPNEKKVVKAKLGYQNNFYYDEKLKRWVNKNATEEEKKKMQEAAAPPPPPIVKRKDTVVKTTPRPSFSHPNTNSLSSAPSGPPPGMVLPVNPLSGKPMNQASNNISASTSTESSATPKLPPSISSSQPVNLAGKASNGLDDILNISAATTASRRKKKPGRGYVNVMENR
ncbi:COPII coat assembly protein SEC16 PWA37_000956 [Arxiozyma heterogenica]|uniref:Protein transport protein sec16 n=1 Tax=Arxiozyma heterogenica TaxID=278026 RepID=A0AAN7ZXS8_9SACH|nr:hypothetical protein RI543_002868 [Kazachstania heterogenica]